MHWEEKFVEVASHHEGLVAVQHLPEIGCSSIEWWRAIRTGRWMLESARVMRSTSAPDSVARRVLGAVLDAGPCAVLHAETALAWQGMRGFDLRRLHTARPRGLTRLTPELSVPHHLRRLRAHDVVVVHGVPSETALRAIWAIAERYASPARFEAGFKRIGAILDAAHRLDLVGWEALAESVDGLRERGRSGTRLMRELSAARPPGSSPAESTTEDRLNTHLLAAGERPLHRQRVLGGHEPIGRIDYSDLDVPAAVEVNSLTFHTTPTDRANDELRYRRLMQAGFAVGAVWEPDVWSRPDAAVRTVVETRRYAAAHEPIVLHSPGCPWTPPLLGVLLCP